MLAPATPLVLGGRCLGHLLSRDGGIEARDAQGKSLGLFRTLSEAAETLRRQELEA
jgi:hypothetical protein